MRIIKPAPGLKPMKPIKQECWFCGAYVSVNYSDLSISFEGNPVNTPIRIVFKCPCCNRDCYVTNSEHARQIRQHWAVKGQEGASE